MTSEQLEAARAERMRQNGHGASTADDVRTWIEETGLCVFLPRSTQGGQPNLSTPTATPTFVEAVAGQKTNQPSAELIHSAETLLVRLEAEGVAVRLNLAGHPLNAAGDQPDYIVAAWVLPYIYALRGDRDWRRSPQLTGSRQVSPLAVQAAKHIDSANLTATQIRDALGREVTEAAVLRALHELWKQLRIIPVVPEVGGAALWQPLRQRFQKAIAEGASTSQVTAISVLASIYLQAVIAASMEDIEMFLSPLTSRSKIREVVRGLAATRQVHTTSMGQSPMFYVAGTLPEFPAVPSFEIAAPPSYLSSNYSGSTYLAAYLGHIEEEELTQPALSAPVNLEVKLEPEPEFAMQSFEPAVAQPAASHRKAASRSSNGKPSFGKAQTSGKSPSPGKSASPRPRSVKGATPVRAAAAGDRRRAPAPRGASASGGGSRSVAASARPARGHANGNGSRSSHPAAKQIHNTGNGRPANGKKSNGANGFHGLNGSKAGNGWKVKASATKAVNGSGKGSPRNGSGNGHSAYAKPKTGAAAGRNGAAGRPAATARAIASKKPASKARSAAPQRPNPRTETRSRAPHKGLGRETAANSASKRYSFSGSAKQAPKPAGKPASAKSSKTVAKPVSKGAGKAATKSAVGHRSSPVRSAQAKRRG